MKARYIVWALMMPAILTVSAQETYENAKIVGEDLNGTARYVGMGGALDALGADLSTIGSNPAGIGLFRHSTASLSMGMVSQADAMDYSRGDKTHASFDQIGFVYSRPSSSDSYINFAFNYHKSRNFSYILSADDRLQNASQNKLTYEKLRNGLLYPISEEGTVDMDHWYASCNQLDDIYTRNLLNAAGDGSLYYYPATQYIFDRAHEGYVGEYDFNISGNIHDQVYLGLTVGLHDVHYKHYSDYTEKMEANPEGIDQLNVYDERRITGVGADVKLGVIVRPMQDSPFRIGLSVATPTMYDLTTRNYTEVSDGNYTVYNSERYDYEVYTPWKFGLSLGHTFGTTLALGASYEFADYAHVDQRYKTDDRDYYYYSYESSESDKEMNRHTKNTLKGVSTLKVGAELKPYPELAVRLGYNHVSPMYRSDGFKDGTLETDGSLFASATDYTNWKSTNRITCGLGYMLGKVNLDLTYQYSATDGEFSPFMNYVDNEDASENNVANAVNVSNKRHQLLFTVGYHF